MNFSIKQVRYVVAVAQHGSVTRAAVALKVAQPSISMAIQVLEREMGQILFIRQRGRGTTITSEGERFLGRARALLAGFSNLQGPDASFTSGTELHLDCFEDLAPFCAPAIVARLRERHPGIKVLVREASLTEVGTRLRAGASDLAISYGLGLPKGLVTETLQEVVPYALLAADDPFAKQKRISMRSLCQRPLILARELLSMQHILELLRNRGVTPVEILEASSFEMQRSLVANGMGRAIVYSQSRSDTTRDGKKLVCRPLVERLSAHPIVLAYSPHAGISQATEALVKEARAYFSSKALMGRGIDPLAK